MDRMQQDAAAEQPRTKRCAYCGEERPLEEFQRRTGRRAGKNARRGACRACRRLKAGEVRQPEPQPADAEPAPAAERTASDPPGPAQPGEPPRAEPPAGEPAPAAADGDGNPRKAGRRKRKKATWMLPPLPPPPPRPEGPDPSVLSPGKSGVIWMRGHTDKGRRWRQETDLETAVTLVREYAAVVVNRRTIRRLYSNKAFREYILKRDNYTCYFCGKYGDTIDHIVPRAKGGHTTPLNCVTACRECNQNKAALDLEEFVGRQPPPSGEPT
jgi:hypothetical protein